MNKMEDLNEEEKEERKEVLAAWENWEEERRTRELTRWVRDEIDWEDWEEDLRGPAGEGIGSGTSCEVLDSNMETTAILGKRHPQN